MSSITILTPRPWVVFTVGLFVGRYIFPSYGNLPKVINHWIYRDPEHLEQVLEYKKEEIKLRAQWERDSIE